MAEQNYYKSAYSGAQIDTAIGIFLSGKVEADADRAETAANAAVANASAAMKAATSAEASKKAAAMSVSVAEKGAAAAAASETAAAKSAANAGDSSTLSRSWAVGGTGSRAGEDTNNSKYWADKAMAEADRATVPAVESVYNLIIPDRETGQKYALLIENGHISILGVSNSFQDTQYTIIDNVTGVPYVIVAHNGVIGIEEV